MKRILFSLMAFIFTISVAHAELHLVVNKSLNEALPIIVMPFSGQEKNYKDPNNIAAVIKKDLDHSGHFKVMPFDQIQDSPKTINTINYSAWIASNYDYMVIGSVQNTSENSIIINFSLVNLVLGNNKQNSIMVSQSFTVSRSDMRAVAHKISDIIYQKLTGIRGIFLTRIAYVLVKRPLNALPTYYLEVADADGYDPKTLVQSDAPLMSPSWSPNGQKIAYVSLANDKAAIYIVNVATGQQQLVSDFPGINGAPAWSPEGNKLAIVLSKSGQPKIYFFNLVSKELKQITFGSSIDTEPSFAPDGKSIIFTSNRGGGPQIYRLSLLNHKITRLTFEGEYNARPSFTSDGKNIVILHQNQQGYNIAIQNLASGAMRVLTNNGFDSTPSIAPNGQSIIFANDANTNGALEVVSTNGNIYYKLPVPHGAVLEPAWSPFLS